MVFPTLELSSEKRDCNLVLGILYLTSQIKGSGMRESGSVVGETDSLKVIKILSTRKLFFSCRVWNLELQNKKLWPLKSLTKIKSGILSLLEIEPTKGEPGLQSTETV